MSYICPIFLFKLKLTGVSFSRFQPRTLLALICLQDEREDTLTNGMFKKFLPSRLSFTKENKNGKNSKRRPDTIKFCRGDTVLSCHFGCGRSLDQALILLPEKNHPMTPRNLLCMVITFPLF